MNLSPKCAKCGACTAVCPVYRATGRESLSARGRLHLLDTMAGRQAEAAGPELTDIFSKCLLCGRCRAICPRGIDIPARIMAARAEMPRINGFSSFTKFLAQQALARPRVLTVLAKAAAPLGLIVDLPRDSGLRLGLGETPLALPALTPDTPQPATAAASPTDRRPAALYFAGCLATHVYPAIGLAAERLLDRLCGYQLFTPERQNCCGLAAKSAGDIQQARELARRTITLFSPPEARETPIFTTCASCHASLANYPNLFDDDSEWRAKALAFSGRVWEFSSFLLQHGGDLRRCFRADLRADLHAQTVLYHDPCHLRGAGITQPPRQLLAAAPGLRLLELPHGPQCCGRGGLFHLAHPDLSQTIRAPLIEDALASGAERILTSCTGCLLQWQQGLQAAGVQAVVTHLSLALLQQLA